MKKVNFDDQRNRCRVLCKLDNSFISDEAFLDLSASLSTEVFNQVFSIEAADEFTLSKILCNCLQRQLFIVRRILTLNCMLDPSLGPEISNTTENEPLKWSSGRNYLFNKCLFWQERDFADFLTNCPTVNKTLNLDTVFELDSVYQKPFGLEYILFLLENEKFSLSLKGIHHLCGRLGLGLYDQYFENEVTSFKLEQGVVQRDALSTLTKVLENQRIFSVISGNEPRSFFLDSTLQVAIDRKDLNCVEYLLVHFMENISPDAISISICEYTKDFTKTSKFIELFFKHEYVHKYFHVSNKILYEFAKAGNLNGLKLLLNSRYPWEMTALKKCFNEALRYKQVEVMQYLYDQGVTFTPQELAEKPEILIQKGVIRLRK